MTHENRLWHDFILPHLTTEQMTMFLDKKAETLQRMFDDYKNTGGDVKVLTTCALCGKEITAFATLVGKAKCDWCWELEMRISRTPELAQKLLDKARDGAQ